tara:strand:- start:274 stop:447 length:174 start_codon:yes stop_codon:yes gene_type:complete
MTTNKYMTMKEAKEYTSLSTKVINEGVHTGYLKSVFIGNKRLFKKEWIDKWLEVYNV